MMILTSIGKKVDIKKIIVGSQQYLDLDIINRTKVLKYKRNGALPNNTLFNANNKKSSFNKAV